MTAWPRLLTAIVLVGTVTAISAAPDSAVPPVPAAGPTSSGAKLSVEEMTERARLMGTELTDSYRHVLALRDLAKKQKDVIKLSCVNDKLIQIKAQMNIADGQQTSLHAALDNKSDDRVRAFDDLATTADGVRRLREEANGCLGEPELLKQEAGVEVTAPQIPDDPTAVDPFATPEGGVLEPPGYASPFN